MSDPRGKWNHTSTGQRKHKEHGPGNLENT